MAGETLRMTDVSSRVALANQRKAEFEKVIGEVTRTGKKKRGPDPAALQQLLDLAGYYDAVHVLRHPEIFRRSTDRYETLITFDLRRDSND